MAKAKHKGSTTSAKSRWLRIPPFDKDSLNVVVETVHGERNKLKLDPKLDVFELSRVLPEGMSFPFDFGFVPRTLGDDGDPLDVLILMDAPTCPGCLVKCRLIGVIEAEQTERDGQIERNDRLLVVAQQSEDHKDVKKLSDLNERELNEIEEFFVNYHRHHGEKFTPLTRKGPKAARRLVERGARRFGR